MAYEEKTDWLPDDPINEDDVNRWEKGIKDAHKDLAAHKNDMNNPHKTTKAQIGLGNVDNVQQAAKKDFDQHNQDQDRHLTKEERQKWDNGQLSKMTNDNGSAFINISEGQDFHQIAASQNKTFTFSTATTGINTPPQQTDGIYLYSSKNNGEAAAFSNDGGFWRKTLENGIWTEWIPYETAAGAQAKVNEHAKKTDIHVTKSDKDKWNAGQLMKLTADNGAPTISLGSESDINLLDAIQSKGTSIGTFYAHGTNSGAPDGGKSIRGLWQMTNQDSSGKAVFGWIYATDYENNIYTNYLNNNWLGCQKLGTESDAQNKADQALQNAKTYADTNFSIERLTCYRDGDEKTIVDARTPGTDYPEGITFMGIYEGNSTGYPLGYGFVKNENLNKWRFVQYFYGNGDERNGKNNQTGTWIRQWWDTTGWTTWEKISGFAHANIGTTGRQELKKGEVNKILFNRKIKDSDNLFDVKNSRFIAKHSGMYLVGGSIYIENTQQYSNFELYVYVNGEQYKLMDHFRMPLPKDSTDSNEFNATLTGTVTVPLDAGDYAEIYAYIGYNGTVTRYVKDADGRKNYFDILEIGGKNYPTV